MNPNQNGVVLPGIASFEQLATPPINNNSNNNSNIQGQNFTYVTPCFYQPFPNYMVTNSIASNTLPYIPQQEYVCFGEPVEAIMENPLKRSSIEKPPYENTKLQVKKVKSEENYKEESSIQASFANVTNFCETKKTVMKKFSDDRVHDFKHVIYNCLVDNYNSPEQFTFVQIYTTNVKGVARHGFRFNDQIHQPEKRLPELYSRHIRKARLELQDQNSVFIQDLYKFYLRACIELLSKYFEKVNKWTYLYEDVPLFVPNEQLSDACVVLFVLSLLKECSVPHAEQTAQEHEPQQTENSYLNRVFHRTLSEQSFWDSQSSIQQKIVLPQIARRSVKTGTRTQKITVNKAKKESYNLLQVFCVQTMNVVRLLSSEFLL